ncbi:hypothetical protein HD806DRAFT_33133 [Xylariaceae sp. AK1471]|nr:hypothetical protein HD806DRAFT_33133 [Xylariaceae sp. AK1471]
MVHHLFALLFFLHDSLFVVGGYMCRFQYVHFFQWAWARHVGRIGSNRVSPTGLLHVNITRPEMLNISVYGLCDLCRRRDAGTYDLGGRPFHLSCYFQL